MQSFVYIEPCEEGIDSTTRQVAQGVRKIASDLRGPVIGVSLGKHLEGKEDQLQELFDEVILVDAPGQIGQFNTEAIGTVLAEILRERGPGLLFLGFTHQGMELAPAVGWSLGVPVVTNCVELDWKSGNVARVRRPIQGGKMVIGLEVDLTRGGVISVQKGAWKDGAGQRSDAAAAVTRLAWRETWDPQKTEVIAIHEDSLEGEDITKAQILVSVGRGVGDPENLPVMSELASRLGGMLSCSRPVVDLGWLPGFRQVGISGRTVTPVIYLALGISGQANHLAGMDASKIIIAVNKDASAPIFGVAHYGVVDNIMEFVPALIEELEATQK